MAGDTAAALRPFAEGTAALSRLPNAEPISIRALWPLIQAAQGDRRAAATLDEVRRLGVDAFRLNRGLIAFAQAVLEGRSGRPGRADAIVAGHAAAFANCEAWADLARFIAAPRALADGWGEPVRWLTAARDRFTGLGLGRLAARCTELLRDTSPNPWAGQGVTDREAEVLRLVIDGLANKEIAAALRLSPRTVEKHVENLLRKTGARSRTELAVTSRHASLRRRGLGATCSPRCARSPAAHPRPSVPETGRDTGKGRTHAGVQEHSHPDDKRSFEHGEVSLVNLTGFTVGRADFRPGWRWSTDVKPLVGTDSCQLAHSSYVVSGRFHVVMDDGRELELGPGDAHLVGPGHDAWVVGDEPCVTIDFIPTGDTVGGRVLRCPCGWSSGSPPTTSSTTWWRPSGSTPRGRTTTR